MIQLDVRAGDDLFTAKGDACLYSIVRPDGSDERPAVGLRATTRAQVIELLAAVIRLAIGLRLLQEATEYALSGFDLGGSVKNLEAILGDDG